MVILVTECPVFNQQFQHLFKIINFIRFAEKTLNIQFISAGDGMPARIGGNKNEGNSFKQQGIAFFHLSSQFKSVHGRHVNIRNYQERLVGRCIQILQSLVRGLKKENRMRNIQLFDGFKVYFLVVKIIFNYDDWLLVSHSRFHRPEGMYGQVLLV